VGRRSFSHGGTIRKASRQQQQAWVPKVRDQSALKMTAEILQDIWKAQALYDAGDWDACEPVIRRLLKAGLTQPLTYDALGSVAQFQGRMDVAIECFRKALSVDPGYVEARNRIIMILDALPETSPVTAARERAKWWAQHGADRYARRRPPLGSRDPHRPIRVGYVSADFQFHSAATVFHRIVTEHSEGFVPYLYSSTPYTKYDQITNTYRAMPGWRDVVDWPDILVAEKIRDDQIDVLVDLSNFTAHNRLGVFASKPAPIQLTGFGYALATGFPCFDGVLTDRIVTPPGTTEGEPPVYLPSVIDYQGTEGLPEANPLPCLTERPTFGVFQRSLKINAHGIRLWARVLERLPEARLIMKSHYSPSLQQWIREQFGAQSAQVEIRGATSSYEHKLMYSEIDLNLDPFPQTAGVSGCDGIYMGVPMVTLLGERAIQRTSASLLTNLGLTDFITTSEDAYVDTAVERVTTRRDELAAIRQTLRATLVASPICFGYTEAVEAVYRDLWHTYCAKPMTLADAAYRLQEAVA
jgi:predicted O-linked N-acetylglucosamine transferase (SPINDLY family)